MAAKSAAPAPNPNDLPESALAEKKRRIYAAIRQSDTMAARIDLRICTALREIEKRALYTQAINRRGQPRYKTFAQFVRDLVAEARRRVRELPKEKRKSGYKRINESLLYNDLRSPAEEKKLPLPTLRVQLQVLEKFPKERRAAIWTAAAAKAQTNGAPITAQLIHDVGRGLVPDTQVQMPPSASDKLAEIVGLVEKLTPYLTLGPGADAKAEDALTQLHAFVATFRRKERKERKQGKPAGESEHTPAPEPAAKPKAVIAVDIRQIPPAPAPACVLPAELHAEATETPEDQGELRQLTTVVAGLATAPPAAAIEIPTPAGATCLPPDNSPTPPLEAETDPMTQKRPFVGWCRRIQDQKPEIVLGFSSAQQLTDYKGRGFADPKSRGFGRPLSTPGTSLPKDKFYWSLATTAANLPQELKYWREELERAARR